MSTPGETAFAAEVLSVFAPASGPGPFTPCLLWNSAILYLQSFSTRSIAPALLLQQSCTSWSGIWARQLAQRPLVQGLPVVHLLRHRVGAAVVVQLDEPRVEVRDDLGDEHAVGEVARDVSLRPRQRDLVDPLVQRLELGVGNLHGTSMRRGRCVAAPWRKLGSPVPSASERGTSRGSPQLWAPTTPRRGEA